jgi:putative flavoprotein involved in K+ transport
VNQQSKTEHVQTLVIGSGQAGMSIGYHLRRHGLPFAILDGNERIGDAWRNRWDSLRLFAPRASMDSTECHSRRPLLPTKNEMADYLQSYAVRFDLPIRTGIHVDGLSRHGNRYVVTAGNRRFEAEHVAVAMARYVAVAMARYQVDRAPQFARELDPRIGQFHSRNCRNLEQLRDGGVLIVGAGNSAPRSLWRPHASIASACPGGTLVTFHSTSMGSQGDCSSRVLYFGLCSTGC